MKTVIRILALSASCALLTAVSAFCGPFGTDITIWDQRGVGSPGIPMEDGEVEPGTGNNQAWDMEGFFLKGQTLTMVGGFDFRDGNTVNNYTYRAGDIFLDTNGDASFGVGASRANFSGYDYVLDLDIGTGTYDVIQLIGSDVILEDVLSYNSPESSPWRYVSGGNLIDSNLSLTYIDFGILTDTNTGLLGGSHNALSLDLSFLGNGQPFIAHATPECGNDNLMGSGTTPVPEPATLLLFGVGLIGMASIGRKKFLTNV